LLSIKYGNKSQFKSYSYDKFIKYFQKTELLLCARKGCTNSRATSLSAFLADIEAEYMR
jgi:hypothetical protein